VNFTIRKIRKMSKKMVMSTAQPRFSSRRRQGTRGTARNRTPSITRWKWTSVTRKEWTRLLAGGKSRRWM
jgi:hypothetical protein